MMQKALSIVADENIPFVEEAFGGLGTVRALPGQAITPAVVRAADVLLVRSVTRVDRGLVEGSALRFVGSATIGTDHVDEEALGALGIAFAHAPGSNAESVVEYVLAALLHVAVRRGEALRGRTVGIVGCGNIGGRLAGRLPALGLRVLAHDPPLADRLAAQGRPHRFVSLETVLAEADIVTLHVPLTRTGPYATHHLLDASTLARMKPDAWLLNTCRGAVVSGEALLERIERGAAGAVVLDVWEHEPAPDPALMRRVDLATPHIAGYSFDGKVTGTVMLYRALLQHLQGPPTWDAEAVLQAGPEDCLALTPPAPTLPEAAWLGTLVRQMYDIAADDARLREGLALPPEARAALFRRLRRDYPRRRTFLRHTLAARDVPPAYRPAVEHGLGVRLVETPGGAPPRV